MKIYKPTIKGPGDTSNFNSYPDSDNQNPSAPLKPNEDPFLDWWFCLNLTVKWYFLNSTINEKIEYKIYLISQKTKIFK